MCSILDVSETGYYRYVKKLGKPGKDAILSAAMQEIMDESVYSDRIEHSARSFRADLPPFQSNLSALLSTRIRKSSAYLSGYECNDRFSIPPESLFRAL